LAACRASSWRASRPDHRPAACHAPRLPLLSTVNGRVPRCHSQVPSSSPSAGTCDTEPDAAASAANPRPVRGYDPRRRGCADGAGLAGSTEAERRAEDTPVLIRRAGFSPREVGRLSACDPMSKRDSKGTGSRADRGAVLRAPRSPAVCIFLRGEDDIVEQALHGAQRDAGEGEPGRCRRHAAPNHQSGRPRAKPCPRRPVTITHPVSLVALISNIQRRPVTDHPSNDIAIIPALALSVTIVIMRQRLGSREGTAYQAT